MEKSGIPDFGLEESLQRHKHREKLKTFDITENDDDLDLIREAAYKLVRQEVSKKLGSTLNASDISKFANDFLEFMGDPEPDIVEPAVLLTSVNDPTSLSRFRIRPATSLNRNSLVSNDRRQGNLVYELDRELESASAVDVLISFVMASGVNVLSKSFRKLRDRGVPVRLITSTYMGISQISAIEKLKNDFDVSVKVDLDGDSERLHAKAWVIHRANGYSTAFVGSSNMSSPALAGGREWNVRISESASPNLFKKISATFDSYWASRTFESISEGNNWERLQESLSRNSKSLGNRSDVEWSGIEVSPRAHQIEMLNRLEISRKVENQHKNLVVSATGTGKTVLAALDYKSISQELNRAPKLLFVAHRREILFQSLRTFREVLGDPNFGELLVNQEIPNDWQHVFASVQSISSKYGTIPLQEYEYVVIDEFHHAEAKTYRKLIAEIAPIELLGLTATPERSDGVRVQDEFFNGSITAELRLWEALDLQLLSNFTYFGVGDSTDLSDVKWTAGKFESKDLEKRLLSNADVRNRLLLREIKDKIGSIDEMKAIAFCASRLHAKNICDFLNSKGIPSAFIDGDTDNSERKSALRRISTGALKVITSVDVFNEGVDIPELNTVFLLRPTESPVVFLQQIGRALRKHPSKNETVILDFVAAYGSKFRSDLRYKALVGVSTKELEAGLKDGFPFLPSGCNIVLDELAKEHIFANIKAQVSSKKQLFLDVSGSSGLLDFLDSGKKPISDIYPKYSWTQIYAESSTTPLRLNVIEKSLLKSLKNFAYASDPLRQALYKKFANENLTPSDLEDPLTQRVASMFFWNFLPDGKDPSSGAKISSLEQGIELIANQSRVVSEFNDLLALAKINEKNQPMPLKGAHRVIPLYSHARYTRYEQLAAIDYAVLGGNAASFHREGVQSAPHLKSDLILVTLGKEAAQTSPDEMYADYALSKDSFHWESQPKTTIESPTGIRYSNQVTSGDRMILSVRESSRSELGTSQFLCLGTALSSELSGSAPIKMTLKLDREMPLDFYMATGLTEIA